MPCHAIKTKNHGNATVAHARPCHQNENKYISPGAKLNTKHTHAINILGLTWLFVQAGTAQAETFETLMNRP